MHSTDDLILWAESQAEAEEFLRLLGDDADFEIRQIFVGKRSRGSRDVGHRYLLGTYYPYDPDFEVLLEESVTAPDFVTSLVQWCSPDLILTDRTKAIVTIESTYHELAFNNVAQRIPRQVRSATLGIPSVIFQKIPVNTGQSFVAWFAQTFLRATELYGTACLALMFTDAGFEKARSDLVELLNHRVNDRGLFGAKCQEIIRQMEDAAEAYNEDMLIRGSRGSGREWLSVSANRVEVIMGVRDNCALTGIPNFGCQGSDEQKAAFRKLLKGQAAGTPKCVWLSKGTGGMDPYPGLIKMAEILLCYDARRNKVRSISSRFSKLPEDFWWFQRNQNEIYYRLVNEFSEEVRYAEDYR